MTVLLHSKPLSPAGIGAVVGEGTAPGFANCGLRQRRAHGPIGVAGTGQVVHDGVNAVGDSNSDRAIGQESGARDDDLAIVSTNDCTGRSDRPRE